MKWEVFFVEYVGYEVESLFAYDSLFLLRRAINWLFTELWGMTQPPIVPSRCGSVRVRE